MKLTSHILDADLQERTLSADIAAARGQPVPNTTRMTYNTNGLMDG